MGDTPALTSSDSQNSPLAFLAREFSECTLSAVRAENNEANENSDYPVFRMCFERMSVVVTPVLGDCRGFLLRFTAQAPADEHRDLVFGSLAIAVSTAATAMHNAFPGVTYSQYFYRSTNGAQWALLSFHEPPRKALWIEGVCMKPAPHAGSTTYSTTGAVPWTNTEKMIAVFAFQRQLVVERITEVWQDTYARVETFRVSTPARQDSGIDNVTSSSSSVGTI